MDAPRYDAINETFLRVFWKVPKLPNGPLDMVELKIMWRQNNRIKQRFYSFSKWISGHTIPIDCPILTDEDDLQSYNLTVRAVNVKDGQKLYGSWSERAIVNMCFEAAEGKCNDLMI